MQKTWYVLQYELINTITRPTFLFAAIGIPIISALLFLGLSSLNRRSPGAISAVFGASNTAQAKPEGFVDQSGLIRSLPAAVPSGAIMAYPDKNAAQNALDAGQISAYYWIPSDYLDTGQVIYIRPDFNPLSGFDQSALMQWVLLFNLLGEDDHLATQVSAPLNLQVKVLEPTSTRDENNPLTFYLPYAVMMLYYITILMSSSLLLSSVTKEKENRVIEILMSSINSRQLLGGKIIGLGLAGLLQTILWGGTAFILLRLSGQSFQVPASFQLPVSILIWGLIFFLLGYAVYASLMAAVGALVPNLREASQATLVIILPLIVPMMLINVLVEEPNGTLSTALSLFPLTSPIAMMTRFAATEVPTWQLLLSAGLLAATAVLIVRGVAGMFRAQTLLSGQPFSVTGLINALVGRS